MIVAINNNKKDRMARAVLRRIMISLERDVFILPKSGSAMDIRKALEANPPMKKDGERHVLLIKKEERKIATEDIGINVHRGPLGERQNKVPESFEWLNYRTKED